MPTLKDVSQTLEKAFKDDPEGYHFAMADNLLREVNKTDRTIEEASFMIALAHAHATTAIAAKDKKYRA